MLSSMMRAHKHPFANVATCIRHDNGQASALVVKASRVASACPADAVWCVEIVYLWPVGEEFASKEEEREVGKGLNETGTMWFGISIEIAVEDAGEGGRIAKEDKSVG